MKLASERAASSSEKFAYSSVTEVNVSDKMPSVELQSSMRLIVCALVSWEMPLILMVVMESDTLRRAVDISKSYCYTSELRFVMPSKV